LQMQLQLQGQFCLHYRLDVFLISFAFWPLVE